MALFFDAAWFDAQLEKAGLKRGDVATALGLSPLQIEELWKDQRELKANDVRLLAALLASTPAEIAQRAGISTPVPKDELVDAAAILARLDRIEAQLADIKTMLAARTP